MWTEGTKVLFPESLTNGEWRAIIPCSHLDDLLLRSPSARLPKLSTSSNPSACRPAPLQPARPRHSGQKVTYNVWDGPVAKGGRSYEDVLWETSKPVFVGVTIDYDQGEIAYAVNGQWVEGAEHEFDTSEALYPFVSGNNVGLYHDPDLKPSIVMNGRTRGWVARGWEPE